MTKSGNHEIYSSFVPPNKEFVAYLYKKSLELGDKDFSSCLYAELPDNLKRSASNASSRPHSSRAKSSASAYANKRNEMMESYSKAYLSFEEKMKSSDLNSNKQLYYKFGQERFDLERGLNKARRGLMASTDDDDRDDHLLAIKHYKEQLAFIADEREELRKSLGIAKPAAPSSGDDEETQKD